VRAKSAVASLYIQNKQYDRAIVLSRQCIEKNPYYDRPYLILGRICELNKNHYEAIEWYKKCLNFNPSSELVHLSLGEIHLKQKYITYAFSYYNTALKNNPNSINALSKLAEG
jgi:tetratricopeptide (TPR) repeat protein